MKAEGVVHKIYPTNQITDSFRKRDLIIEIADNPEYPQQVKFELIQDKCELLNDVKEGQRLSVEFNLNGREWTNQKGEQVYFNTLQVWKIDKGQEAAPPQPEDTEWLNDNGGDDDDLPF